MPNNPFLGNKAAEEIFNATINYINEHSSDNLSHFANILASADEAALTAIGANGTTLLLEIFDRPFDIHQEQPQTATFIVYNLFDQLMKATQAFPNTQKKLLLTANHFKCSPFLQILKLGSARNVHDYLKATYNHLTDDTEYKDLLTSTLNDENTTLHVVAESGDSDKISYFIDTLKLARQSKKISDTDYYRLFIGPNSSGNTPLLSALFKQKGHLFIDLVNHNRFMGLRESDYHQLLTHKNQGGFSILTQSLKTSDVNTVQACFLLLLQAKRDRVISKKDYEALLIYRNANYVSPLHHAINARDPEKVKLYLHYLGMAYRDGIISAMDYWISLARSQIIGISLVHDILDRNNVEILNYYFQAINHAIITHHLVKPGDIKRQDYVNLFIEESSVSGYTPLSIAIKSTSPSQIMAFMNEALNAKKLGLISAREYVRFLMGPNSKGYTPLIELLKSEKEQVVAYYLQLVQQAREEKTTEGVSIVDVNDLRYLFLHVHRDESTSLNYAFRASNQDNLTAYINALSQLMIEKIITYSEFGSLLTRFNSKLSTALTSASMSKNPDHLCYYFTLLKWAKSNGCITAETYKTTLITPTFEQFTPLHSVLTSKHELSLALYLEALDDADLYSDEWFHLLTCRHKFGLNPLKQALDTKQITIINLYMDALYSVLPLFENHELQNFLLGTNNAVKNPLNFLILCGNYDLVCKFLSIIVHRFGQEFLMRELKQSHSQGTPKYYYHKKDGVEGIQINRLIDTIRAGLTLTEAMESIAIPSKASQMTIIDDLPDTKEPTEEPTEEPIERKRPRMESTMGMPESRMPSVSMVVPGQNLMGPLRQSLGLSAPQIKPPSTVSELMLRTIRDTAQAVTATTALAPQSQITGFLPDDLTMSITRKLIHIAQTIVYQYGLDPAHICFYGSTAQLVVGHRPDSSLPKDIDLRLFVYESALVRIQQNLLSKQKSLKIEDAGRFLLVKGFAVEGIDLSDSIDIQVIKMRDGDRVLDYIDTLRWSSYLNVCTDYCIFNAPNTLIPCPGPSHESRVKFIDPRGVEIPQVDDLFQLYGAPYDLKAKDLFFFLKKWDYYSNAGYDVVALKQAIINTMAYQYGFELGKQIFSRSDKLGMRLGAQMIYKLCGKDYVYHPDDAFEMHHHELLKMVDPRIISVLYVNRNEAVAIRLNIPQRYSVAPAGSGHGFFSGSSAASAYTALSHSGAQAAPPPSECAMPQT